MANLHKFTVQESLNASTGNAGGWTVNTLQTVEGSDDTLNELQLNDATTIVVLQATVETQIRFTTTSNDSEQLTTGDISIPASSIVTMNVPRNLGTGIYLQFESASTTHGNLKIVEV
jgi:hypothetical protein